MRLLILLAALAAPALAGEQAMETASGTFEVTLSPLPGDTPGVDRRGLAKRFHGQLEGSSSGQMLSAGNPGKGEAGYVALEMVTGTLAGRQGGFALQHSGSMAGGSQALAIQIVPGSGTGALAGISGSMVIRIADGVHHYTLSYALPAAR